MQAQQLEAEVVRMRSQQDALRRRMEELSEKYEEKNRGEKPCGLLGHSEACYPMVLKLGQ
jgi:hypothetical protein